MVADFTFRVERTGGFGEALDGGTGATTHRSFFYALSGRTTHYRRALVVTTVDSRRISLPNHPEIDLPARSFLKS